MYNINNFISAIAIAFSGVTLAYYFSQGIGGISISFCTLLASGILIRTLDRDLVNNNKGVVLITGIGLIILLATYTVSLFVLNKSTTFRVAYPFFLGVWFGGLLTLLRPAKFRIREINIFIVSIVLGCVIFNLLILSQVPIDTMIKETLAQASRNLGHTRVIYLGRFAIENHIAVPYCSAIGILFLGISLIIPAKAYIKLLLLFIGAVSLLPTVVTLTRGPLLAAVIILALVFPKAIRRRALSTFLVIIPVSIGVVYFLYNKDFSAIIDRMIGVFDTDGRYYLWTVSILQILGLKTEGFLFSNYAHNYVLDLGLQFGPVIFILFVMHLLIWGLNTRYYFLPRVAANVHAEFLWIFIFTGFILSWVQPPSQLTGFIYGFSYSTLPYLISLGKLNYNIVRGPAPPRIIN